MPIYVVEHKTSGESLEFGGSYWRRLNIDIQVSVYVAAAKSLGYGNVAGVLYDVLRKSQHRPSAKGETPEAYGKRILTAICEDPDRYYRRGTVVRLEAEADEAAADVWQNAGSIRDARRLRVFPRNSDACVQWSRECEYLPVCCGEASIDDPMLYQKHDKKHSELDTVDDSFLTQSSIRAYRSCPRKYYYRYETQIRSRKDKAEPLRMGTSIHRALECWWKSGGDLEKSLTFLDKTDPYLYAKEAAMIVGYHAKWPAPTGVIAVEKEWVMDLINPETGAKSKTFRLAGKTDCIVEMT